MNLARAAALTSSHAITSSGFAKWSARRRSNSNFCASVNEGTKPRLTIPVHIASASSICSSISSTLACCKSCVLMIAVLFIFNEIILARLTVLFLTRLDHQAILRALAKTSSASMLLASPRSYSAKRRSISSSQAASTSAMAGSWIDSSRRSTKRERSCGKSDLPRCASSVT
jgi:hypothetical protein